LAWFRAEHARGRITDADLAEAVRRRLPELADLPPLSVGRRTVSPVQVLLCDVLHGAEPEPAAAPRGAAEWCDTLLATGLADAVDEQVAKWCAAFCAGQQGAWAMPGREHGLYRAWRALIETDPGARRIGLPRQRLRELPGQAEDAILDALAILQVPDRERGAELRAQLTRLPGWAGHIAWRAEHPDEAAYPADLVDLLAVRLSYEAALVEAAVAGVPDGMIGLRALAEQHRARATSPLGDDAASRRQRAAKVAAALSADAAGPRQLDALDRVLDQLPAEDRGWIWLDAYEWHYRDGLLQRLSGTAPAPQPGRPAAQAVFCIDARSEGMRRRLESRGHYETFGFPGFFQLSMRFRPLAAEQELALCPAPVTPTATVVEQAAPGQEAATAAAISARQRAGAAVAAFHGAKDGLASPFALAEASGWLAGPLAALKTVAPVRFNRSRSRLARRLRPPATALALAGTRQPDLAAGYRLDEQVDWAEFALRSLGLLDGFARLVLLCGHGSGTENNAFEAALDCGACGGQP
ncbi:MAG TPA: putative inorganic carbon transporter subunit DabA, partial [Jatrophihabitans sp.]|nr:putative inorganic carbon transporter subunit DabA [Jatrophihabitans sp.]